MTNGRGAGMASFMTRKKKYKFQVEICLEELLEVPLITAVLFAKLRLLDGGNFQDTSSREEVRDHKVKWGAKFTFPCKMMANATTGVMERCVLRISIRKESRGGRSFTKLGFVDLNLAEYAGAGVTHRKALLEGYDTRHRQDNSMLQFSLALNMLQGDILFKVPSPSLKHKQLITEDTSTEPNRTEEFSGGSLGGSIASGSSGFGSLPKKRPQLLTSELVIGQTLTENNVPITIATDCLDIVNQVPADHEESSAEPGHSRNSSNTSQLSKASGYSSIHSHSHSRQSSSGDSGHIRSLHSRSVRISNTTNPSKFTRTNTYPKRLNIPTTIPSSAQDEIFSTPQACPPCSPLINGALDATAYYTPTGVTTQLSNVSTSSTENYATPEASFTTKTDIFSQKFLELKKSSSSSVFERHSNIQIVVDASTRHSDNTSNKTYMDNFDNTTRSKSEFEIPRIHEQQSNDKCLTAKFFKSDNILSYLTPRLSRKGIGTSTPSNNSNVMFRVPDSPISKNELNSLPETRATSLNSLRSGIGAENQQLSAPTVRRNPSSSSLVCSETGSLDRVKTAYERRKKAQAPDDTGIVSGRVEITRVNPDDLIEELLKNTNLEPNDDSAETSGLQLFIAKDGTAALGNHEVKSQMSTGVQVFKQVVMDDR